MGLLGRTKVCMGLLTPPPRTMSTLAISMIASEPGSIPVVSMSMTRIKLSASYSAGCGSRPRVRASGTADVGLPRAGKEIFAPREHVFNAAPATHVMAPKSRAFEAAEGVDEVDGSRTRRQVQLIEPIVVGETHLLAATEVHARDEPAMPIGS